MNTESSHHAPHRFSVAPMLDVTDRHARYFYRQLSSETLLYSEMVTTGAIIHGDSHRFLHYDECEHPLALQLGGSDPRDLAQCCQIAQRYNYDEINLNVGCPSNRVQSGQFGACLMASPHSVKDCVSAMQDATPIPISVKCRLGIDDMNTFEHLRSFIDTVSSVCSTFIIHARHAWLQGLSPKDNRNIPPLMYDWVYKIKQLYPHLTIIINGGITSLDECHSHLQYVDGVMLGRHIQQNPLFLTQVDETIFDLPSTFRSIEDILYSFFPYIETELNAGTPLQHLTRHLVTFYKGTPGAKKFRRYLSEHAHLKGAGIEVIEQGIQASRSI